MKIPFPRESQTPDGKHVYDSGMWSLTGPKPIKKATSLRRIPLPKGAVAVDEIMFWEQHVEKVLQGKHEPHVRQFALQVKHMIAETRRLLSEGNIGGAVATGFAAGVAAGLIMATWRSETMVRSKRYSDDAMRGSRGARAGSVNALLDVTFRDTKSGARAWSRSGWLTFLQRKFPGRDSDNLRRALARWLARKKADKKP